MKKLIIVFLFAVLSVGAFAQDKQSYIYCELVGTGKLLSTKVNVQVDFGQAKSFWKGASYLKDENGKTISFNSMVDAMNFMGKEGWEFVQAYVVSANGQNVYRWLLRQPVDTKTLDDFEAEE